MEDNRMTKSISREEIEKRLFEKHGDNIILLNYEKMSVKSLFKCAKCGHTWEALADAVVRVGHGCPKCKGIKTGERCRTSFDEVKKYVEDHKCKLISTEYKNNRSKIEIEFECGHYGVTNFGCFKRGHRCFKCSHAQAFLNKRLSQEEIELRLRNKDLSFIEYPNGNINRNSLIIYICDNGHIETQMLSATLRNGCLACNKVSFSEKMKGKNGPGWKGGATGIIIILKTRIKEWKLLTAKKCNYECVLCDGHKKFDDIHHLHSFLNIFSEALNILNLEKRVYTFDYSKEEFELLENKIVELHREYPGVCLCRAHHRLFHFTFGFYNNTPQQFEKFKQRIESGELILSE
jgi:hypothetical protein